MTDYSELLGRLLKEQEIEAHYDTKQCAVVEDALTAIQTLTGKLEEVKRNEAYTERLMQDWRRIANAMGYEPSALDKNKPLPEWLAARVAMFRQKVIDEATATLRAELTDTKARLAEAVGIIRGIEAAQLTPEVGWNITVLNRGRPFIRAFLAKQEPKP